MFSHVSPRFANAALDLSLLPGPLAGSERPVAHQATVPCILTTDGVLADLSIVDAPVALSEYFRPVGTPTMSLWVTYRQDLPGLLAFGRLQITDRLGDLLVGSVISAEASGPSITFEVQEPHSPHTESAQMALALHFEMSPIRPKSKPERPCQDHGRFVHRTLARLCLWEPRHVPQKLGGVTTVV